MDRGQRYLGPEKVIQIKTVSSESEDNNTESEMNSPTQVNSVRQNSKTSRKPWVNQSRQDNGCFTYGKVGHRWIYCPEPPCSNCGRKGHETSKCFMATRSSNKDFRNFKREDVLPVNTYEETVTLQVKLGSKEIIAMLDTVAKPSLIDRNALSELNLQGQLVRAPNEVYGLCNSPVRVLGYVDVKIQVGVEKPVIQRLCVLDSEERTVLLGRQFMEQFDEVTFDWKGGSIRLGKEWQPAQTMLSGSTPLARARMILDEILELQDDPIDKALINPKL